MTPAQATWNGSLLERSALLRALLRNCTCSVNDIGAIVGAPCGAHEVLFDQRALDGLLFSRRQAVRLRREEFGPGRVR